MSELNQPMDTIDQKQQEQITELEKKDIVHDQVLRTVQLLLGVIAVFVLCMGAIIITLIVKYAGH